MAATKKIVRVRFNNNSCNRMYDYLLPSRMRAEVGDIAVVNSPHDGIVTTTIVDVLPISANKAATKYVEAIVSMQVVRDLRAVEEEKKLARARLDVLLAERLRDNKYAALADNAEARDLMSKLGILP